MRKLFYLLSLLAIVIFSGCSRNYMAEREYYHAEKVYRAITDSQVQEQGPQAYDPAIEAFQKVVEKYPGTPKALDSLFTIAELYIKQENYEKARDTLRKVVVNFSGNSNKTAEARFQIAKIYEVEDKWGQAEAMYWELSEYNPLEIRGLQAPIQILTHYLRMDYKDAANRVYRQALEHYETQIDRLGPIEGSIRVRNYVAVAHTALGKWKEAREEFLQIINDFPGTQGAAVAMIAAAEASQKMNQANLALSLYQRFVEEFPESPMAKQMQVRMGLLYQQSGAHEKAREHYRKALEAFGDEEVETSDIKLLMARSYQAEGNWEQAKALYDEIETQYSKTAAALQVPLMRAAYHESQGNAEESKKILAEAVQEYQAIALKYPNTPVEKLALRLINDAQFQQADWEATLNNLDTAIAQASTPEKRGELILMKAIIADKQMNNKEMALDLYNRFLADYSGHTLAPTAKNLRDVLVSRG